MDIGMDMGILDFVSRFHMYNYRPPSFDELSLGIEAEYRMVGVDYLYSSQRGYTYFLISNIYPP